MNQNDFERLNLLSEKSLLETITPDEFEELNQLMNDWNTSVEFNLVQGIFSHEGQVE